MSTKIARLRGDLKKGEEHFNRFLDIMDEQVKKAKLEINPKEYFKEVSTLWKNEFQKINQEINSPVINEIPEYLWDKIVDNFANLTQYGVKKIPEAADVISKEPEKYKKIWLEMLPNMINPIKEGCKALVSYNIDKSRVSLASTLTSEFRASHLHKLIKNAIFTVPELGRVIN